MNARVFVKAADRMANNESYGACHAIWCASSFKQEYENFFVKWFKPEHSENNIFWYGESQPENRLARSLALLLCAELVRDEA